MGYRLERADLDSVRDPEVAFGTERLLPPWDEVPEEFRRGNIYTRLAEALCFGWELPDADLVFKEGFGDADAGQALNRCVRAHLESRGPKHEHKIAGVGFMIAQACELQVRSEAGAA